MRSKRFLIPALALVLFCLVGRSFSANTPTPQNTPGAFCPGAVVDASTLAGKLIMGYQGWFGCPGDGGGLNFWHYGGNPLTGANIGIDPFPDESDLAAAGAPLYNSAMVFPGAATVKVSSNRDPLTVSVHFQWMKQYNIDGVMLQRFTSEIKSGSGNAYNFRNQVTQNVMAAAETYGRVFCVMWDVSGDNSPVASIETDWPYLVDTLKVTQSASYLNHEGRPLVVIWGFSTGNSARPPADLAALVNFFHNNANSAYRATVMAGVGDWNNATWKSTVTSCDVISPWTVGGYKYHAGLANPYVELDNQYRNVLVPEAQAAAAAGSQYMPVIWPGFSAHNEVAGDTLNDFPRMGGLFYWRQAYFAAAALRDAGLPVMIYNAMYDEVNEGTSMFKMISATAGLPTTGTFLALDADGFQVPNDWYLRLAGEATRMVHGSLPISSWMPLDPNYPANSGSAFSCVATATYTASPNPTPTCLLLACCAGPGTTIKSLTASVGGNVSGVCGDPDGNITLTQPSQFIVRRADALGNTVTILGGNGCNNTGDGGPGPAAAICNAACARLDSRGNLYVSDSINYFSQIRRVSPNGTVTTWVNETASQGFSGDGSLGLTAYLDTPRGLALDLADNLYIADSGNHRIRLVDAASGVISTVAGNGTPGFSGDGGPAVAASLSAPAGVLAFGGHLYIADTGNQLVRDLDLAGGIISTLAGNGTAGFSGDNGPATAAALNRPCALAMDSRGHLLVADQGNNRVRQVTLATGIINTLAGSTAGFSGDNGPASSARLNQPSDLYVDDCSGNIYIADKNNNRVRVIVATCVPTPTNTPVLSPTPTFTISQTHTFSPTASVTPSFSPSATSSATRTGTPTASPTPTVTQTWTTSPTASPSSTDQPTPTPALTFTISPTPFASLTPAVIPGSGGSILEAMPLPNPSSGSGLFIYLKLDGPADQAVVSLYTSSLRLVFRQAFLPPGGFAKGWNRLPLPPLNLPTGIYFGRAQASGNSRPFKLWIFAK